MKRIILLLAIIAVVIPFNASADSYTLTPSNGKHSHGNMLITTIQMEDTDATDNVIYTSPNLSGYYLYSVETWPGSTAPTDASDLAILATDSGADMLGGIGTDILDATSVLEGMPIPTQGNTNAMPYPRAVTSTMTFAVNNNDVAGAIVNVKVVYKRAK